MTDYITSRRAVLVGTGGIAAAGALATAALALPVSVERNPSAELLAYHGLRQAYDAAAATAVAGYNAWLQENSPYADYDALLSAVFTHETHAAAIAVLEQMNADADGEWSKQVLDAAREAIIAREVRSIHDLAELAEVVRIENRWVGGEDGEGTNKTYPATAELRALFAAIEALAGVA
jgi:hypothetical protein